MKVIYSQTRPAKPKKGWRFQNPRFFVGVLEGADTIEIHGDWPVIAAAYAEAGAKVTVIGGTPPAP